MSTKNLRKLRGNRVFEIAHELGLDQSTSEEEEEEDAVDVNPQPLTTSEQLDIPSSSQAQSQSQSQIESERKGKERKRQKAKKKRKKEKQHTESSETASQKPKKKPKKPKQTPQKSSASKDGGNDEEHKSRSRADDELCSNWELLRSDARYFDPSFELKKKYGSVALEANHENDSNDSVNDMLRRQGVKNSRQRRLIHAKTQQARQKYAHLQKRRIHLIKFNAQKWPAPHVVKQTGNIYMELLREEPGGGGVKHFQFRYDKDYTLVQLEYKQRCARYDPHEISFLCQQHPFHVDACLTMSDILRKHGQFEEASDLVGRALYRLETGLHSRFSFVSNDGRLDYGVVENRSFFLALFKYAQMLGGKGCVHSAFELSKSLLCLSPLRDPLCSLLCLDYWALRAGEYDWVLQFAAAMKVGIHANAAVQSDDAQLDALRVYPSWCYSVAFAKYQLELQLQRASSSSSQTTTLACDASKVPMDLGAIEGVSASLLMQQAILMYPEVIAPLLQKANERVLAQAQWKQLMQESHFLEAKLRRNEVSALGKLCRIYSERCYALWNNDALLKWLCTHCQFVVRRLQHLDEERNEDVVVFDALRTAVFDGGAGNNQNKFQLLDVNDFSDVVTTLPAEQIPDALVRPQPLDLNDLQQLDEEELRRVVDQLVAAGIDIPEHIQQRLNQGQNIQQQNALQALLYSILPNVNPIFHANNRDEDNDQDEQKQH